MNEVWMSLSIGIISGLLATFLLILWTILWKKAIQPWYEDLIYKDAMIEGKWIATYPDESDKNKSEERVIIKRQGHSISGNINVTSGDDKGKIYDFKGTFKNLILSVIYSDQDRRGLDIGSITLMLKDNGSKLIGISAYYQDRDHIISYARYEWVREGV